jgi:hypothetical protein
MNDDSRVPINDARILAAMKAVNPPLEKLMADRLSLRREVRRTKEELEEAHRGMADLRHFREVRIPRYIAISKLVSLSAAGLMLAALVGALFFGLFELKTTASLFASLILPLWLTDAAERSFGRWRLGLGHPPIFVPATVDQ